MAWIERWLRDRAGLTLVEILVALGILAIGLIALFSAFPVAFSGISSGRQSSTALFLAVQRLEEIKALAMSPDPAQGFANVIAANFPGEPYAAISGYARYRRQVTIADSPVVPANTKSVRVTVFYHPTTAAGGAVHETAVSVSTLIASR
jgi:prepilin-type N-terminal cleavage/methylation domain-containing protein